MAETKENSLSKAFVGFVLERASAAPKIKDTGFVARMKRADNPDLEYQVWNILLKFNVDIEFAARRLPFCLGASLRSCFGDDEDQGSIRLRRLLACQTTEEVCRILRPMLSLITVKATKPLCFATLLDELLYFESNGQERIKMRWTRDFYSLSNEPKAAEGEAS